MWSKRIDTENDSAAASVTDGRSMRKDGLQVKLICLMVASLVFAGPRIASAQHPAEYVPVPNAPFAVGTLDRKPLPPQSCTYCTGPRPCVPCDAPGGVFLYYGTYPWDDDCHNGFDDCPHGNCGYLAVRISHAWIAHKQKCSCALHKSALGHGCGECRDQPGR